MDTPDLPSSPVKTTSPDVITLSEEQLRVSSPVRVRGRVRLIKYVETETVTQTVQVRREHLRVEVPAEELAGTDQPIQTASADNSDYSWLPQEFEFVLHEERVEMVKTVVGVEKVHVRTRIVTTDQPVSAELGREQIELSTTAVGPEVRSVPR